MFRALSSDIQKSQRSLKTLIRRMTGSSDRGFDDLRPESLEARIRVRQAEQLIKQNLLATLPCTATLAVAFLISLNLSGGPFIQLGVAIRALGNVAFMVVMGGILAQLRQGRFTTRHEDILGVGTFFSSLLWGTLIWPLESNASLDMLQFMIITISLVSIVVTMLIASHLLKALKMASLGALVGVLIGIHDAHPAFAPMLAAALVFLIFTVWAYATGLNRETRRGIILNMRMEILSNRLAQANNLAEEALAKARWLADHDSLTKLRNRRAFEAGLVNFRAPTARNPHVLMLLDIDHFKSINDRFGHDIGDSVLMAIGTALHQWEADGAGRLSGRWGGEEFIAVIAPQGNEEVEAIAEDLRQRIELLGGNLHWPASLTLTTSIGCTELATLDQFDEALVQADRALYAAKNSGRNCWKLAA